MSTRIVEERPDTVNAATLVNELEEHLSAFYPQESRHGLSVERLINEGVAFFVIYHNEAPAGCGGVKLYGDQYGEVKRMYVRDSFRGLGLGKRMLEHLADYTRQQGVALLRLETGVHQTEAIGLYERFGFQRRGKFGDYQDDPLSLFYEKQLTS